MPQYHQKDKSPVADELRELGLARAPSLWVRAEDIPQIHRLGAKVEIMVKEVRRKHRTDLPEPAPQTSTPMVDPRDSIEAAWAEYERIHQR